LAGKTAVLIDGAVKHIPAAFRAILLLLMVVFTVYSLAMRYVFALPLYGMIDLLYYAIFGWFFSPLR
jgi:TRAP-type C4-dicarboxylate transport system permease small subunit